MMYLSVSRVTLQRLLTRNLFNSKSIESLFARSYLKNNVSIHSSSCRTCSNSQQGGIGTEAPTTLQITDKIISSLKTKGEENVNIARDLHISKASRLIDYFLSMEASPSTVKQLFEEKPELSGKPLKSWKDTMNVLINSGFSCDESIFVVSKTKDILDDSADKLMDSLEMLRHIGLGEAVTLKLVLSVPYSLKYPKDLLVRVENLKSIFRHSDLHKLVSNCPVVFFDNFETIQQKINYIVRNVGLDQRHMVRSGAFNYSLDHIKVRHMFLVLIGLYKKPDEKHLQLIKLNPNLIDILQLSDVNFVKTLAPDLTVEEYECFKHLFETERVKLDEDYDDETSVIEE